jgi:hypothetical protein
VSCPGGDCKDEGPGFKPAKHDDHGKDADKHDKKK